VGHRLLVAGDRSHAGKSTVSLGLLSALLEAYMPSELAYIKPATQCVSSTLTARFCEERGIACEHIGPVVFYRGFTRAFLDEQARASEQGAHKSVDAVPLPLAKCVAAVARISEGKRLTVIDGVGYPAVGSIVGCSSADVAVACRAPVLIVGKSGIGDAVDSFNLCARYFEAQRVPVLGAIFNKVPASGFYGLAKCRHYLRLYMATSRPRQRVYGLLPQHAALESMAAEEGCGFSFKHPEKPESAGPLSEDDRRVVDAISELFDAHVDIKALLADLDRAHLHPSEWWQASSLTLYAGEVSAEATRRALDAVDAPAQPGGHADAAGKRRRGGAEP